MEFEFISTLHRSMSGISLTVTRIGPVSCLCPRFRPGSAAAALAPASGPALVVLAHFPVDRISQR